jgi:hypothetical protein
VSDADKEASASDDCGFGLTNMMPMVKIEPSSELEKRYRPSDETVRPVTDEPCTGNSTYSGSGSEYASDDTPPSSPLAVDNQHDIIHKMTMLGTVIVSGDGNGDDGEQASE